MNIFQPPFAGGVWNVRGLAVGGGGGSVPVLAIVGARLAVALGCAVGLRSGAIVEPTGVSVGAVAASPDAVAHGRVREIRAIGNPDKLRWLHEPMRVPLT
ncbi:MAG: hypothetical protein ABI874_06070 [Chloroflexota bacterium]